APPVQPSFGGGVGGGGGGNGYVPSVAGADSGAGTGAGTAAATKGSLNVLSTALPLPELLQELQQWMISLGLGPGPRDEAGFAERGNFRWVTTGTAGLITLSELIGGKHPIPDHLRSWTDTARVCAHEADLVAAAKSAAVAAGGGGGGGGRGGGGGGGRGNQQSKKRKSKPHALPQS
ncbi:unnamed protein product, partial [Laminaria digitata]